MNEPFASTDLLLEQKVRIFRDNDFISNSEYPLALVYDDNILVLFYNSTNSEDMALLTKWQTAARQTCTITLAAVDLSKETKIAKTIETSGLLSKFPTVIIYGNQLPQGIYEDILSLIANLSVLVCDRGEISTGAFNSSVWDRPIFN